MINTNPQFLLYIEPKNVGEAEVNDELAQRVEAMLKKGKRGIMISPGNFNTELSTKGFHRCVCGACSAGQDVLLENGLVTNTLAAHYLRFHRSEVPQSELDKIL